jgi:hypothetical protein
MSKTTTTTTATAADTITLNKLKALAEQLAADAALARAIYRQASIYELTPARAAAMLKDAGIAIL